MPENSSIDTSDLVNEVMVLASEQLAVSIDGVGLLPCHVDMLASLAKTVYGIKSASAEARQRSKQVFTKAIGIMNSRMQHGQVSDEELALVVSLLELARD